MPRRTDASIESFAGRVKLVVSRRAMRGASGSRLGSAAGSSLEFHDYRDYQPGDDVRSIDWNVLARSDREVIRRHREEVTPVLDLFVDSSASMRACGGAAAAMAESLSRLLEGAASRAGCRTRRDPGSCAQRSVRVLVSDLLVPDSPETVLAPLERGAAALHVIRVLPEAERSPRPGDSYVCEDPETGERRELSFDEATLAAHAHALQRHTESWLRALRLAGGTFTDLTPEGAEADGVVAALVAQGVVEVVA